MEFVNATLHFVLNFPLIFVHLPQNSTLMPQHQNISEVASLKNNGEIVMYQPDNDIRMEVRLDKETVWLTQQQIADLFGVKQPAVSKHLSNIFKEGELDKNSVYSILEYTAAVNEHLWTTPSHDRWLIVDDNLFHCGHSIKDMGKKLTAIMLMGTPPETILNVVM